jgi:NitT/TauT family transport system substrate-binding protein
MTTFQRLFGNAITWFGGLALALSASSAGAQEMTPIKLRLSWTPFGFHTALFLAVERGWMREGGVDLQVEDGSGSTSTVNLLGTGQYDIGEAAVSAMAIGRDKGMPLKSIADYIRGTDLGILVPRGAGIKGPKDLEGKKIAYTAASLEGPFMEAFLKAAGVNVSKVELLNVDFASKIPTYVSNKSDAVVTTVPFILPILVNTRPSDAIMFGDYGFVLPSVGYIATEQTIRTKRRALQSFVTAVSRGWHEILEEKKLDEGVAALLKHRPQAKVDPKIAAAQVEAYRAYFYTSHTKGRPHGWHPPEDWVAAIASMQKVGLIKASAKPQDFYTNEFFPR